MDSLPPELQDYIIRQLDLNDLARCRRVSRGLRESVHRVLSTITSVRHELHSPRRGGFESFHYFTLASILSVLLNRISHAEFYKRTTRSFLRFITKYCPRVSSLVATSLRVQLEDISAIAPRLKHFSLMDIESSGISIDAKSLVTNFPNLQSYTSQCKSLCPQEVMREYSLLPSSQFAKYDEFCPVRHTCQITKDVRSMESLLVIMAHSPLDLHELRPSSLSSLQYLKLTRLTSVSEHLPPLPNLLSGLLNCGLGLNNVIRDLQHSSKLSSVDLNGNVNNQSVPAIQLLLSKCRALQVLTLRSFPANDYDIDDDNGHTLDLSQAKGLIEFDWSCFCPPVEVILPSQCQIIKFNPSSVEFSIDGRSYKFDRNSVSFSKMNAYAHPVEIKVDEFSEEIIDRVIHLCPQVSCLTLKLAPDRPFSPNGLEKILAKTDVSEIIITAAYTSVYEPDFVKFLSVIDKHPERSFSIKIFGYLKNPLKLLIKPQITQPFIIHNESEEGPSVFEHVVEIPAAVNVLPSDNSG